MLTSFTYMLNQIGQQLAKQLLNKLQLELSTTTNNHKFKNLTSYLITDTSNFIIKGLIFGQVILHEKSVQCPILSHVTVHVDSSFRNAQHQHVSMYTSTTGYAQWNSGRSMVLKQTAQKVCNKLMRAYTCMLVFSITSFTPNMKSFFPFFCCMKSKSIIPQVN